MVGVGHFSSAYYLCQCLDLLKLICILAFVTNVYTHTDGHTQTDTPSFVPIKAHNDRL